MGPIEKWHADIRYEKEAKAAAHKKATQPSFTPPPVVVCPRFGNRSMRVCVGLTLVRLTGRGREDRGGEEAC